VFKSRLLSWSWGGVLVAWISPSVKPDTSPTTRPEGRESVSGVVFNNRMATWRFSLIVLTLLPTKKGCCPINLSTMTTEDGG
jgi:hypothetical protein